MFTDCISVGKKKQHITDFNITLRAYTQKFSVAFVELSWLCCQQCGIVSSEIILLPGGPASSPSESKHLPC